MRSCDQSFSRPPYRDLPSQYSPSRSYPVPCLSLTCSPCPLCFPARVRWQPGSESTAQSRQPLGLFCRPGLGLVGSLDLTRFTLTLDKGDQWKKASLNDAQPKPKLVRALLLNGTHPHCLYHPVMASLARDSPLYIFPYTNKNWLENAVHIAHLAPRLSKVY